MLGRAKTFSIARMLSHAFNGAALVYEMFMSEQSERQRLCDAMCHVCSPYRSDSIRSKSYVSMLPNATLFPFLVWAVRVPFFHACRVFYRLYT